MDKSDNGQTVLDLDVLEVFLSASHITFNLRLQLINRAELLFVTQTMQEPHAHYIAIKIAGPIHHEGFDRRFRFSFKSGSRADVGNAAPPLSFKQGCGDIHALERDHTIARLKIRGRKAQFYAALSAAHDPAFYAIRPAQHAARAIHSTLIEQFADASRTDAFPTETHLRNFLGKESEILADALQKFDVPFAIMTESKTAAEIDVPGMQPIGDHVAQEIFGANLGERFVEMNDDRLFDSQNAEGFDFLIESLQEWRRRFRMQDGARVRLERNYGWDSADRVCAFDDRLHNELMAQMKAVEHAEC